MKRRILLLKFWIMMLGMFFTMMNIEQVHAAEKCSLLQISTDGQKIISYIEYEGNIDSVEAQVAQYPCKNVEMISPEKISVHTIILLDNSLSITESNRENIKEILQQYIQNIPENEVVSLAVFGEEIQFLAEKERNTEDLLQYIDEIEFHDQDTYLTDYLFQTIQQIENDSEYTRFIIISDGVDNKTIGITKEELYSKLNETPRPVYAIGHLYKDNSDELKNMFALARMTGGKEFLIEDFEDVHLIEAEIHDFSNVYSVRMEIPENVMDGDNRHILLSIHTGDEVIEIKGEASMPFTLIEPEPEQILVPEQETVQEPIQEPVQEPDFEETEPDFCGTAELASAYSESAEKLKQFSRTAGCIVLVIALVGLILCQKIQKSKNRETSKESKVKKKKEVKPDISVEVDSMPNDQSTEEETVILGGRYLLVLRDNSNPEKIFRYPLDEHVIVGRNVDMVQIAIDHHLTVSGQHCEFYCKNNRFYIRDLNSANHTYLEGNVVDGETEIMSGNIVRLGKVELSVEIMPI